MAVKFKRPERCLLVQAALYISEGKLPISDAVFLSAPDHPVTCPKDLIRALRDKQIVASGSLFEAIRTDQISTDTILAFEPFSSWPTIENVEIDAELWSEDRIDIARSRLIGKNDNVSRIYRVPPLDPDFLLAAWGEDEKPVAVETAFIFSNITVSTADLFRLLPPPSGTIVERTARGGRPPKYRWDDFFAEIIVRADLDGLPETQAGLVRNMAEWCLDKWGDEPAESVLKEKISPIYKHPRKAQKKKS
jgi:hypothetical protein